MSDRNPKVLIIALDGFTWTVARPLMQQGVMPTLSGLVQNGCHGNLTSVIPCETAPAWTAFLTGCLPDRSGIFYFLNYHRPRKKIQVNSFNDIAVPTLWDLADNAGKRIISINMPMTWPPPKINGIIIPGLMSPDVTKQTVFPPEIYDRYLADQPDYDIVNLAPFKTVSEFFDRQIATEQTRCRIALSIMNDHPWDIACVQLQSIDHVQHEMWPLIDPELATGSPLERRDSIRFYSACDRIIEDLVRAAGPNALTVILSDHGFQREQSLFLINVWLRQKGYLTLNKACEQKRKYRLKKEQIKRRMPWIRKIAAWYGKLLSLNGQPAVSLADFIRFCDMIDLEASDAFCLGSMAGLIYINGPSESRGVLAQRLSEELLADFGPDSVHPLLTRIESARNIYPRIAPQRCCDLVVHFLPGVTFQPYPMGEKVLKKHPSDHPYGTHDMNGILLLSGDSVKKGFDLNAGIIDVAPTLLAWMGLPVPHHMDGRVLKDAFGSPPSVRYRHLPVGEKQSGNMLNNNDEAQIEKRLKDLGYL